MIKNEKAKKWLAALIFLTLAFIWGQSLFSRSASTEQSLWVLSIFDSIFGEGVFTDHIVRKLAHFTEYAVLGAELYLFFGRYRLAITHGLFAALADESLQMLSDRSAEVKDVLIDFGGVIIGAACLLLAALIFKIRERKNLSSN